MIKYFKNKKGVAAMVTVVIIGAAALLMAFSASMLGLGELEQGYVAQQGGEVFAAADGCLEEALRRLRLDDQYAVSSTENLTLFNGSCTIDTTDLGSNQRRVVVKGTVGDYNKKIQIEITLSGAALNIITIDSWAELNT